MVDVEVWGSDQRNRLAEKSSTAPVVVVDEEKCRRIQEILAEASPEASLK
jgi:predicted LPLAT superfamily acyltransferase